MEENFDALDVIARTRGKVDMDSTPTANPLFVLWGSVTAFFYLLEFIFWPIYQAEWCLWLWIGVPVIACPLMVIILKKDRDRSHMRSRRSKIVLDYWIFTGTAICLGGFLFGFADVYYVAENPMICLLVGIGAFITGEATRYKPMVICGLIGAAIGIGAFTLQGDLWYWQMLAVVVTAVIALIIPGVMYKREC